jgi:hypothetical protein
VKPSKLRGSLGNRYFPRLANQFGSLAGANTGTPESASRHQFRAVDSLTAMDCDVLAVLQRRGKLLE